MIAVRMNVRSYPAYSALMWICPGVLSEELGVVVEEVSEQAGMVIHVILECPKTCQSHHKPQMKKI